MPALLAPNLERIRPGEYRIIGVACDCGGELRTEECGRGIFKWETFCTKCLTCDPNGWPNLKEVLANLDYWSVK